MLYRTPYVEIMPYVLSLPTNLQSVEGCRTIFFHSYWVSQETFNVFEGDKHIIGFTRGNVAPRDDGYSIEILIDPSYIWEEGPLR